MGSSIRSRLAAPNDPRGRLISIFVGAVLLPEWQWYAEAWGKGEWVAGPIGFIRDARPVPARVQARPPAGWPNAKWFRGAGWAALHSSLMNPGENVQLMMRAAPLGNISHSHADQNAVVLGAFGSPLLVNTGIRPWYGSPFCREWYWTTKPHNALEIDGQGQPKTAAATGRFIVFQPGSEYDYVAGDPSQYEAILGLDPARDRRWRLSPNLTWYPSEFSKLRLQ